jgi:hypothetical protein
MRHSLIRCTAVLLVISSVKPTHARSETKKPDALSSLLASYKFRRVHLEKVDTYWSLRISINGKPGALIIATAAPISVLDRNSLARFGIGERKTEIPLNGTLERTNDYVGLGKYRVLNSRILF